MLRHLLFLSHYVFRPEKEGVGLGLELNQPMAMHHSSYVDYTVIPRYFNYMNRCQACKPRNCYCWIFLVFGVMSFLSMHDNSWNDLYTLCLWQGGCKGAVVYNMGIFQHKSFSPPCEWKVTIEGIPGWQFAAVLCSQNKWNSWSPFFIVLGVFINYHQGWVIDGRLAGHSKMIFWIHDQKDWFFLHLFILASKF